MKHKYTGSAKSAPKRKMTAAQCDAGYRLLSQDRHPELEQQRQFDDTLRDAQEAQRIQLAGLEAAEGETLDEKLANAQRARQKRLNHGVAL